MNAGTGLTSNIANKSVGTFDVNGLYDIYGSVKVPFWQTTSWYVVCGILIGSMVTLAIIKTVRTYRRTKPLIPWEVAHRELVHLAQQASQLEGKEAYFQLTSIVKKYLHQRYGHDLVGKTDEESLVYLEKKGFPADLLEEKRAIVTGCAFIKFANAQAAQQQIEQDIARARVLVDKTIPSVDTKRGAGFRKA